MLRPDLRSLLPALLLLLPLNCREKPSSAADGRATVAPDAPGPIIGEPVGNRPPTVRAPVRVSFTEGEEGVVVVTVADLDGDPVRVTAASLPPGAVWHEAARTLVWRPDFTQGGADYDVVFSARDGAGVSPFGATVRLQVADTYAPRAPVVVAATDAGGWMRYTLRQTTDSFLDSPGYAGRTFDAVLIVPKAATLQARMPMRVALHGFSGGLTYAGAVDEVVLKPHDPDNTYWWGYASSLPGGGASSGAAPPYTQRRILHLVDWVRRHYPVDPERIYVSGMSMGGAGAAVLGLLSARHFCYVEARVGQMVAPNHRPSRVVQLSRWWGTPEAALHGGEAGSGLSCWERQDLARALVERPEARDQFIFTRHGKDDLLIHFGAVVHASPHTGRSFYQALQDERIGHYVVWDEGGHVTEDPKLGALWSDRSWHRVHHAEAYLRRDLPFPAFTGSAADQDPGDGTGNGKVAWAASSGYAAKAAVAGNTGWSGAVAGARNRFLRWDATRIVDTFERLEMPLKVLNGDGKPPPAPGYPTRGNLYDGPLPLLVDVTPRRVRGFVCLEGETIRWSFGERVGTVVAGVGGVVTVPRVALTTSWQTLVLRRAQ